MTKQTNKLASNQDKSKLIHSEEKKIPQQFQIVSQHAYQKEDFIYLLTLI